MLRSQQRENPPRAGLLLPSGPYPSVLLPLSAHSLPPCHRLSYPLLVGRLGGDLTGSDDVTVVGTGNNSSLGHLGFLDSRPATPGKFPFEGPLNYGDHGY